LAFSGCTSTAVDDSTVAVRSTMKETGSTGVQSGSGTSFAVESLELTFVLPETFRAVDDPDYLFLARSMIPRSVFTVDEDVPEVTDHEAEQGESLSELDLTGVDAVVVSNAMLEGLPSGVSANELLVSNGTRSFSVIMSAATADLPELWKVFVRSVAVTPTD
jgi:hypothetical protein